MKRSLVALLFGLALLALTACAGGERGIVVQSKSNLSAIVSRNWTVAHDP